MFVKLVILAVSLSISVDAKVRLGLVCGGEMEQNDGCKKRKKEAEKARLKGWKKRKGQEKEKDGRKGEGKMKEETKRGNEV